MNVGSLNLEVQYHISHIIYRHFFMIMPITYYSMLVLFGYCSMLMVVTDATETVSLKQIFFFVSRDELCHYV